MKTIKLTTKELTIIRHALLARATDLVHEEDSNPVIKLLDKLPTPITISTNVKAAKLTIYYKHEDT